MKSRACLMGLMWLTLGVGLNSCQSASRGLEAPSNLATIKIGNFGSDWKQMSLKIIRSSDQLNFLEKSIAAESFSNGAASIAVKVPYNTYNIELKYFSDAEGRQLVMQSCPDELKKEHIINQPSQSIEVKICSTEGNELGVTPPVDEADVSIDPFIEPEHHHQHPGHGSGDSNGANDATPSPSSPTCS